MIIYHSKKEDDSKGINEWFRVMQVNWINHSKIEIQYLVYLSNGVIASKYR